MQDGQEVRADPVVDLPGNGQTALRRAPIADLHRPVAPQAPPTRRPGAGQGLLAAAVAVGVAVAVTALLTLTAAGPAGPPRAVAEDVAADPARYPYFAAITAGNHSCGGALVAPTWVLTAAHCVSDLGPARIFLLLSNGRFAESTYVAVHPLYDGLTANGHDLAMIQVPPGTADGLTPIMVGAPFGPDVYAEGTRATALGLGRFESQDSDVRLRANPVILRSDRDMKARYAPQRWIEYLTIGADPPARPACIGENGGPLVVELDGRPVLVGVKSFGRPDCAVAAAYGELDGAQAAWVASWGGPPVVAGWGSCRRADGTPGTPFAWYGTQPDEKPEGPLFFWSVRCDPAPGAS